MKEHIDTRDRPNGRRRLAVAALLPLLIVAVSASLFLVSGPAGIRTNDARLSQWRRQLATGTDSELVARIRSELKEDDASPGLLVEALASGRSNVADAARAALMEHVDRLQLKQSRDDERRIAFIVHELARRAPAVMANSVSRRAAKELATRVLVWTVCHGPADGNSLLVDCETVLRVREWPARDPVTVSATAPSTRFVAIQGREAPQNVRWQPTGRQHQPIAANEDQFALPGGHLPVEVCDLPRLLR